VEREKKDKRLFVCVYGKSIFSGDFWSGVYLFMIGLTLTFDLHILFVLLFSPGHTVYSVLFHRITLIFHGKNEHALF